MTRDLTAALAALTADVLHYSEQQMGERYEPTGRALIDGERLWIEIREAEPEDPRFTVRNWFSDDGHTAENAADALTGESAWLI